MGLVTKVRKTLHQNRSGNTPFSRGHLYLILSNPTYMGRIRHRQHSYAGEHEAIIDTETWEKTQAQLAANAGRKRGRTSSKQPSLLAGLLFTAEGVPFTPSHAVNHGKRYRYYAERSLLAEARVKMDKPKQTVSGADGKPNVSDGEGLASARIPDRAALTKTTGRVFERPRGAPRCPRYLDRGPRIRFRSYSSMHQRLLSCATQDHPLNSSTSLVPWCGASALHRPK